MEKIVKSEEEWEKELPKEVFAVARKKGTEPAFSGEYNLVHDKGIYRCRVCGLDLFSSNNKFDSGTGWPSFDRPISPDKVEYEVDESNGMTRTEVKCARCGSHLGHIFNDGPAATTGKRYCLNSVCLSLKPEERLP
jgi:peptide-methionine (R)-S-oxide reductase